MKINLLNPCGGGYVTPAVKVVEFQPEGVLCGSFTSNGIGDAVEEAWPELG